MERKFNKKITVLTGIVLMIMGGIIGFLAMYQFLYKMTTIKESLKILFYCAGALVPGLLLFFSAHPFLGMVYALGSKLRKVMGRTNPMDIAGLLLGISIGLMLSYLVDVLLRMVLGIISLRILICIIVGLVSSYVAAVLCTKWLSNGEKIEEVPSFSGFLLTENALSSDKIIELCKNWLAGGIYVMMSSVKALIADMDNELCKAALSNYTFLTENNLVKTITVADKMNVVDVAISRYLKIVTLCADDYAEDCGVPILALDSI